MNNIHIGCGYTVGKSWKNYDVTPTSRFEKIPILGKIIKINQNKFPKEVIYGDITKKPLCQPGEADNIFRSHNSFRVLLIIIRNKLVILNLYFNVIFK